MTVTCEGTAKNISMKEIGWRKKLTYLVSLSQAASQCNRPGIREIFVCWRQKAAAMQRQKQRNNVC